MTSAFTFRVVLCLVLVLLPACGGDGHDAVLQGPAAESGRFRVLRADRRAMKVIEEVVDAGALQGYVPLRHPDWGRPRIYYQVGPDGERIAFTSTPLVPGGVAGIFVVDLATLEVTPLVIDGAQPEFSPDGDAVASVRAGAIWKRDLATGVETALTAGPDQSRPSWQ